MAKLEAGDILYCPDCDLELTVNKPCNCDEDCSIKCCDTVLLVRKPGESPVQTDGSCCCGS